jgi:hypothetical protein
VDFVNRLTPEAEDMNHHPDLAISWNKVTVSITTHSEGGLTENDFEPGPQDRRIALNRCYSRPRPPMSDDDDPRSSTRIGGSGLR